MKTFLISITSDCEGVKENYLDTVANIGDSAEIIMVSFLPYPPHADIHIIPVGVSYPGNLRRFDYFPKGFRDDDMIVFTDASDVIFQAPIPQLNPNVIYLANEYEKWGGDNWWTDKLKEYDFNDLDGTYIYNMGTWAMSYKNVKSLLTYISENKIRFNNWVASDQVLFNMWLAEGVTRTETISPLTPFACLYNGLKLGKFKKKKGKFYDEFDNLVPIVHANGNNKDLLVNKNL